MLPRSKLVYDVVGGEVVPRYLDARDQPWLRALLEEVAAFDGLSRREFRRRLARPAMPDAPQAKQRMVAHIIDRMTTSRPPPGPRPRAIREMVFDRAQAARDRGDRIDREAVIREVAKTLEVQASTVDSGLFADLAAEQQIQIGPCDSAGSDAGPSALPDPPTLAAITNLALAQGVVRQSTLLELRVDGQARAVVRQALLRRLICTVRPDGSGYRLEISGACALFRRSVMYGRILASLLPLLQWCHRFQLDAHCVLDQHAQRFRMQSGDLVFPSRAPSAFDSKLEARFSRDFRRATSELELVREPAPIPAAGTIIFPDFAVRHRHQPDHQWFVELVGFWTPEYLASKLQRLRAARLTNLLLCIDESLGCAQPAASDSLPNDARVLFFKRRIDVEKVLEIVKIPPPRPHAHRADTATVRCSIGPSDLFLDYAGRHAPEHPIHAALAALSPGSELGFEPGPPGRSRPLLIVDSGGRTVAALSAQGRRRWSSRLDSVRRVSVRAILKRAREESGQSYRHQVRVDTWRLPLLEVECVAPPRRSVANARPVERVRGPGSRSSMPATGIDSALASSGSSRPLPVGKCPGSASHDSQVGEIFDPVMAGSMGGG